MNIGTLTPAYGRDYKNKKEVQEALNQGKDFIINNMMSPYDGKPTNKEDLLKLGIKSVMIRYKKLTCIHSFKINN